ncbi:MAG: hypothetical protein V1838_00605 [Patescibacteria group bacterium]
MKLLIAVICLLVTTIATPDTQAEPAFHAKMLFHANTDPGDSTDHWTLACWTILNDPGSGKYLTTIGPRYQTANLAVEFLTGAVVKEKDKSGHSVTEVRNWFKLGPYTSFDQLSYHANGMWYLYLDFNKEIIGNTSLGIETENFLYHLGENQYFAGPRFTVKLGKYLTWNTCYQFSRKQNQFWFRMILAL